MIEYHYSPDGGYWCWMAVLGESCITGAAHELAEAIESARAAEALLRDGMQVEPPAAG